MVAERLVQDKKRKIMAHWTTFLSKLCWGRAAVAYTKPQQRRMKEESKRLWGERDQIKFIDLRFEILGVKASLAAMIMAN